MTIAHGKSRYQQKDSTLWGLASTWEIRLTGPIPRPERTLTQYQRNGTLPPGLAKRDLPADLSQRLPRPRFGTERVAVDNDVLLIQQSTGVILDILTDVIAGG